MTSTDLIPMPLNYLDKALTKLRDLGLMPEKPDETPVVAMIQKDQRPGRRKSRCHCPHPESHHGLQRGGARTGFGHGSGRALRADRRRFQQHSR